MLNLSSFNHFPPLLFPVPRPPDQLWVDRERVHRMRHQPGPIKDGEQPVGKAGEEAQGRDVWSAAARIQECAV